VLGKMVYWSGGRKSSRLGSPGDWPRLVRRMATVMICAPLACTASRVCAKSRYLPVPTIRRDVYALPAMVRVSWESMRVGWAAAPGRKGRPRADAPSMYYPPS